MSLSLTKRGGQSCLTKDLEFALAKFQATLTDEERQKLRSQKSRWNPSDADAAFNFTLELDEKDDRSGGRTFAPKLCSLLQTVQSFAQVIDVYVSANPDIAALIWGSVRFTFMALINFTTYFESFTSLLQGFDHLLPQFTEYKRLFPESERLRKYICEFHVAIVSCCTQIIQLTRLPWKKKALAALSNSFQDRIRPAVDNIRVAASRVQAEAALAKAQYDQQDQNTQRKSQKSLLKQTRKTSKEIRAMKKDKDSQAQVSKWESLLNKLSSYDYETAYRNARSKRHKGTAEWVFNTQEFQDWYNDDQSAVLYLSGKIGSGKTVLTANIIDHIIKNKRARQAISFFFVRFNDIQSLDSGIILQSLVRQALVRDKVDNALLDLLEKSESCFFDHESLLELLKQKISLVDDCFFILDGLDECSTSERNLVLESLSSLLSMCPSGIIKILISARESVTDVVERHLSPSRLFAGYEGTDVDLFRYAQEILREKQDNGDWSVGDKALIDLILQEISSGGEGMFLWVFLTIEDICTRRSDEEIRQALHHIPRSLPDTFNRVLDRIQQAGNAEIAKTIFKWTAAVYYPMTLSQLSEVLMVRINQQSAQKDKYINGIKHVPTWCGNLVQVEEGSQTVHFSHHSIQTYLKGPVSSPFEDFKVDLMDADHFIGEICLTYLNFSDFQRALTGPKHSTVDASLHAERIPGMVVGQTIQAIAPNSHGNRVAELIRSPFWKYKSSKSLKETAIFNSPKVDSPSSTLMDDYPFLLYAKDYWLLHTRNFTPESKTWLLWGKMVLEENAPWADTNWHPPGIRRVDYESLLAKYYLGTIDRQAIDREQGRHSFNLYKAIAYADFLGHQPLFDKIIGDIKERSLPVVPELFLPLLQPKRVNCFSEEAGWHTEEVDTHHHLVTFVTKCIARGLDWPTGAPPIVPLTLDDSVTRCNEPNDASLCKGIHTDVCSMLLEGETPYYSSSMLRIFAELTTMELNNQAFICFQRNCQKIFNSDNSEFQRMAASTWSVRHKSILDLVIERGGDWSITITRWLLDQLGGVSNKDIEELLYDSLSSAILDKNWPVAALFLEDRDWPKSNVLRDRVIRAAISQNSLPPRALRASLIEACIPSRDSDEDYQVWSKRQDLFGLSFAIQAWDVALALHRPGTGPLQYENALMLDSKPSEPIRDASQVFDGVLTCMDSTYVEQHCRTSWVQESPRLLYCETHRDEVAELLKRHGPFWELDLVRLFESIQSTLAGFVPMKVMQCRRPYQLM